MEKRLTSHYRKYASYWTSIKNWIKNLQDPGPVNDKSRPERPRNNEETVTVMQQASDSCS